MIMPYPSGLLRSSFRRAVAAVAVFVLASAGRTAERTRALSPEESLASFQLEAGLRLELVAAEPLVGSPVAFAFDEKRRLFVVEDRGYPDPLEGGAITHEGRVAMLEDTNGDGRYDRRTEFATGLSYPNGIVAWRGGFFVTCAPDIIYLKDTNGDGVADEKRVVLTGFDSNKTAQIRVSHPSLGLDGKIYVTSGLNGGSVTSPVHPERPAVKFSVMDGRFDPDTYVFENTGGRAQFGLSFDAFGRRFICSNRHPVLQVVMEPWQLKRNPYFAFPETVQEVSKVAYEAKVFPISHGNVTADFIPSLMSAPHAGTFTSACGVLVFLGSGLSPEHDGNVFICEPAQNLVQRQVFRLEGASFRSDPPYKGKEFLASTDTWFRPVFLGTGPDGALYVVDMHRREIDHPQYVPAETRPTLDFLGGKENGRIYRIVKAGGAKALTPGSTLGELCRELESPDSWWRERARRLLIERADPAAAPLLEKTFSTAKLPASRTQILWTLRALRKLSPSTIAAALRDADPGVREQGVVLAGESLATAPDLAKPLLAMAEDPNSRVRFAAALVFGTMDDARAVRALAMVAVRDGEDRWARAAVLSGIGSRMAEFFEAVSGLPNSSPQAYAAVMEDLGNIFGAGASPEACRRFLTQMLTGKGDITWRLPSVLGLADGLRGRSEFRGKGTAGPLAALLAGEANAAATSALDNFFRRAAELAENTSAPTRLRVSAVALLGYTSFGRSGSLLGDLLNARQAPEIQLQAVRVLERFGDARGAELLIQQQNWTRYTPQIREAVVASLVSKPQMIKVMFAAIQRGVIKPPEISSPRRTRLLKYPDPEIRQQAEVIFRDLEGGDRMEVYRKYRDILKNPADAAAGAAVFTRACSVCHTYSGAGGKVGPDLSGVRSQPADALLLHIIVPNFEVAPAFQTQTVTTQDGRSISGWLAAETESSLTLRTATGSDETVLRKSIASLSASGLSLMPDGLEQTMTKDEMANLIAYLKAGPGAAR